MAGQRAIPGDRGIVISASRGLPCTECDEYCESESRTHKIKRHKNIVFVTVDENLFLYATKLLGKDPLYHTLNLHIVPFKKYYVSRIKI